MKGDNLNRMFESYKIPFATCLLHLWQACVQYSLSLILQKTGNAIIIGQHKIKSCIKYKSNTEILGNQINDRNSDSDLNKVLSGSWLVVIQ